MAPMAVTSIDADAKSDLRAALGQYATGVAVVTARTTEGRPVGITINSFISLSLDPPLILWCLQLSSASLEAFAAADHFAVNVLAAGQEHVARQFAARGTDRFAGARWHAGPWGIPLVDDGLAAFVCRRARQLPGGDHLIMTGELVRYEVSAERPPLVFHGGWYRSLAATAVGEATNIERGESCEEDHRSQGRHDPLDDHELLRVLHQGLRRLSDRQVQHVRVVFCVLRKWQAPNRAHRFTPGPAPAQKGFHNDGARSGS